MVCEAENVQIEPEVRTSNDELSNWLNCVLKTSCFKKSKAANTLITASNGDLRKAIMFLQSGAKLHAGEKITASSINEMAGVLYLCRYMWITY